MEVKDLEEGDVIRVRSDSGYKPLMVRYVVVKKDADKVYCKDEDGDVYLLTSAQWYFVRKSFWGWIKSLLK